MIKPGIYPTKIPQQILLDKKREGEIQVYELLRKTFPNLYIFYSNEWISSKNKSKNGESDFLIADPNIGFITLEVKGGIISRQDNQWFSKERFSEKYHKIKNPIEQARDSRYTIQSLIKQKYQNNPHRFIRCNHAAIFPHTQSSKNDDDFLAGIPREFIIFEDDLNDIYLKISKIFLYDDDDKFDKLGDDGIQIIYDLFAKDLYFGTKLKQELDLYDSRLYIDTMDQAQYLKNSSKFNLKNLFIGGAGSGKTYLAIEKAKDLNSKGITTLFLTYNKPISIYIANELKSYPLIHVLTLHEFCSGISRKKETKFSFNNKTFLDNPTQVLGLSSSNDDLFSGLIIDEGQDFSEDWLEDIFLYLDKLKDNIYIFADDNQNIYKNSNNIKKILNFNITTLPKNVRNTTNIFNYMSPFYDGETKEDTNLSGPAVKCRIVDDPDMVYEEIKNEINKLTSYDGIMHKDIAILSFSSPEKSQVKKFLSNKLDTADQVVSSNGIIFDSVWRFKGLDRQVIFLVDIEEFIENKSLWYVGFSRARTLLYIYSNDKLISNIKLHINK